MTSTIYAILTSKPGQYHTEPGTGSRAIETYDYEFCGRIRAHFTVVELPCDSWVRIVEDSEPAIVNEVPTKFLPQFTSLEAARTELEGLSHFAGLAIRLVRRVSEPPPAPPPQEKALASITFASSNKVATVPVDSNLLRVSLREGGGIPFKCGAGLCGTCRCRIEGRSGALDAVKDKERKHLSEADLAAGWRMACQTFVHGDVVVRW